MFGRHAWKPWLFAQVGKGYWDSPQNVQDYRGYFESVMENFNIPLVSELAEQPPSLYVCNSAPHLCSVSKLKRALTEAFPGISPYFPTASHIHSDWHIYRRELGNLIREWWGRTQIWCIQVDCALFPNTIKILLEQETWQNVASNTARSTKLFGCDWMENKMELHINMIRDKMWTTTEQLLGRFVFSKQNIWHATE